MATGRNLNTDTEPDGLRSQQASDSQLTHDTSATAFKDQKAQNSDITPPHSSSLFPQPSISHIPTIHQESEQHGSPSATYESLTSTTASDTEDGSDEELATQNLEHKLEIKTPTESLSSDDDVSDFDLNHHKQKPSHDSSNTALLATVSHNDKFNSGSHIASSEPSLKNERTQSNDTFWLGALIRTSFGSARADMHLAARPTLSTDVDSVCLFANDLIEVRKSALGGWGVFAVRDLHRGKHILFERAVLQAYNDGLWGRFKELPADDKRRVLDLYGFRPLDDTMESRVRAIFHTNNFVCDGSGRGAGLFLVASRFNHACAPRNTVTYVYDSHANVMTYTIKARLVKQGEELTITYGKGRDVLKSKYGFDCGCGGCEYRDAYVGQRPWMHLSGEPAW